MRLKILQVIAVACAANAISFTNNAFAITELTDNEMHNNFLVNSAPAIKFKLDTTGKYIAHKAVSNEAITHNAEYAQNILKTNLAQNNIDRNTLVEQVSARSSNMLAQEVVGEAFNSVSLFGDMEISNIRGDVSLTISSTGAGNDINLLQQMVRF